MNVSVVIPAYNAAETIAHTLDTVCAQVYPKWEAIVVDDGSTDTTAEIAREFAGRDPRVSVISQPTGGESAARNTGISQARYDWLLFLDADDWISSLHLQRLTSELRADPELDAIHCGSVRVALDGTEVSDQYLPPAGDMFPTLARRAAFPVHACIVRRALVEAVGKFDTSLQKSADWDLWQRVARTGARFGAVREVLAYYRMKPHSASLDAEQLLQDGLRVLQRGHAPDPRVTNPHPAHASGSPSDEMRSQQFYLLCWCAGLLLGRGLDARQLLTTLGEAQCTELYADAVARCIFEAATLPMCQPRDAWEALWPNVGRHVEDFFGALEQQSRAPDLAHRALVELKRMILQHSPTWKPIIAQMEQAAEELAQQKTSLEHELRQWEQRAETLGHEHASLAAVIAQLQEGSTALMRERDSWQQRAETLGHENASLAADLERWQQIAQEHKRLLAELEQRLWMRLGRRVGVIGHPI